MTRQRELHMPRVALFRLCLSFAAALAALALRASNARA